MLTSILFVCQGNVCRSVFAQRLSRTLLEDVGTGLLIDSAGLDGDPGLAPCPLVEQRCAALGLPAVDRQSRKLRAGDVQDAELILCATREQRSSVVALQPDARSRSFTLLEAVHLAEWDAARADQGAANSDHDRARRAWPPAAEPDHPARGVASGQLVDRLHAARVRLPAPAAAPGRRLSRLFARAPGLGPEDIADGHHDRPRRHSETLDQVEDAVRRLAPVLRTAATVGTGRHR